MNMSKMTVIIDMHIQFIVDLSVLFGVQFCFFCKKRNTYKTVTIDSMIVHSIVRSPIERSHDADSYILSAFQHKKSSAQCTPRPVEVRRVKVAEMLLLFLKSRFPHGGQNQRE